MAGRSKAPVDAPGLNDRFRDIAATGGVKSNDGKGTMSAEGECLSAAKSSDRRSTVKAPPLAQMRPFITTGWHFRV